MSTISGPAQPLPVFTLGHSTRSLEDFLALLVEHDVKLLADVRRFPGSPQQVLGYNSTLI